MELIEMAAAPSDPRAVLADVSEDLTIARRELARLEAGGTPSHPGLDLDWYRHLVGQLVVVHQRAQVDEG